MKKRVWHFKNSQEVYTVLYEDDLFILVQNDRTKKYSFGGKDDFGSFLGFPVGQSCLTYEEAIKRLNAFIKIDKKYLKSSPDIFGKQIERWQNMIQAIEA